jgi:hypothetical protein
MRARRVQNMNSNRLASLPDLRPLATLTELSLSHNVLTDLPASLGELHSLRSLNVNHNRLKRLPRELCQLKSLSSLEANHNLIEVRARRPASLCPVAHAPRPPPPSQDIPADVASLESLEYLDLSFNCLRALPDSLALLVDSTADEPLADDAPTQPRSNLTPERVRSEDDVRPSGSLNVLDVRQNRGLALSAQLRAALQRMEEFREDEPLAAAAELAVMTAADRDALTVTPPPRSGTPGPAAATAAGASAVPRGTASTVPFTQWKAQQTGAWLQTLGFGGAGAQADRVCARGRVALTAARGCAQSTRRRSWRTKSRGRCCRCWTRGTSRIWESPSWVMSSRFSRPQPIWSTRPPPRRRPLRRRPPPLAPPPPARHRSLQASTRRPGPAPRPPRRPLAWRRQR